MIPHVGAGRRSTAGVAGSVTSNRLRPSNLYVAGLYRENQSNDDIVQRYGEGRAGLNLSARLGLEIENIPTDENPGTGRITALSMIAALRGITIPPYEAPSPKA